jgi:hypothetical protein
MRKNDKNGCWEFEIGETFNFEGKTYQCIRSIDGTCGGCAFWCGAPSLAEAAKHDRFMNLFCCDRIPYKFPREDKESVIFIEYQPFKTKKS